MHHRRNGLVVLLTVIASLTLAAATAAPAAAQYGPQPPPPPPPGPPGYYQPPPPPPGVQRYGLTLGGSLGGGSFGYSDEDDDDRFGGGSFEGHIGGMITPQLGVLLDGWVVLAAISDYETFVHNIGTVSLRWFFAQRFWLQGGLGFASLTINDDRGNVYDVDEGGGALMLGAGIEVFQSDHVTLDISLRLGASSFDGYGVNMSSLQVGLNWY